MTCYRPVTAFQNPETRTVTFSDNGGGRQITLPCGRCIGCRLRRAQDWAIRCMHEAQLHELNTFVTLTYNEQNIPEDFGLDHRHFQLFMKRLRKLHSLRNKTPIRYFMCGEYGQQNLRPHYHALLFGVDFPDKKLIDDRPGKRKYSSATLDKLWKLGFTQLSDVNQQTANYVTQYSLKKVKQTPGLKVFERIDPDTGEVYRVKPDYCRMSLKPHGIGEAWWAKYASSDIDPRDAVVIAGKQKQVPKYYDKLLDKHNPLRYDEIVFERQQKIDLEDKTPERLETKERVAQAKANLKKRKL